MHALRVQRLAAGLGPAVASGKRPQAVHRADRWVLNSSAPNALLEGRLLHYWLCLLLTGGRHQLQDWTEEPVVPGALIHALSIGISSYISLAALPPPPSFADSSSSASKRPRHTLSSSRFLLRDPALWDELSDSIRRQQVLLHLAAMPSEADGHSDTHANLTTISASTGDLKPIRVVSSQNRKIWLTLEGHAARACPGPKQGCLDCRVIHNNNNRPRYPSAA